MPWLNMWFRWFLIRHAPQNEVFSCLLLEERKFRKQYSCGLKIWLSVFLPQSSLYYR